MNRVLETGELKALVRQLVKAVGGCDAAGIELAITHQRVSNYQSPNHPDMMPLVYIMQLEAVIGQAIVTGAVSRAVEGAETDCIHTAAVEAVAAAAQAIGVIHAMDQDQHRDLAEVRDVQSKAQALHHVTQRLVDTATKLQPTRRLRAV